MPTSPAGGSRTGPCRSLRTAGRAAIGVAPPPSARGTGATITRFIKIGLSLNTNAGRYGEVDAGPSENRAFIEDLLRQATLADELGYDGIFVAERHSRAECRLPSPLQFLTLAAMRTKRCDLVTHVLLLPLHHPCDVAEQAAVVDIASEGRLVLGLGMGFDDRYFRTFGVERRQRRARFEEGLDVLRLAWSGEPFDYAGKVYRFEDAQVLPRPAQPGGPRLWIGGQVEASVVRAAVYGDAWVVAWPLGDDEWRFLGDRYREECERVSKEPLIAFSRHCWLGESRAEVERWFVPMWLEEMKYYWERGQLRHPDFESAADFTVDKARKHVVYGNADDCVEALQESVDMGIGYLKLSMRLPLGPSMDRVEECIRGFAAEVLPRLEMKEREGINTR